MTCIKQGDRGPEVKNLQGLLNAARETLNGRFIYEALDEDGIFGPAVADALLRYQASECWAESDIFESAAQAGPLTMARLGEGGGSSPSGLLYGPDFNDHLIPIASGQAVSAGWGKLPAPIGITWHWTASWDLKSCRRVLGGATALRKGKASAHFGVGRSRSEGIDRYVRIQDRSWHCGKGQTLTIDGEAMTSPDEKGARTTVGIETVNIGYARKGVEAEQDWIRVLSGNGRQELLIQPWTEEQVEMMVELGRYIVSRNPHIRPEHHQGHDDLCPGYKLDVLGFPWVRVLEGIYDESIEDVWTPYFTTSQRQQALTDLGYDLGAVDGVWGRRSGDALTDFQEDQGLVENGMWTTFVCRAIHSALRKR